MRTDDILRRESVLSVLSRPGERVPGEVLRDGDREARVEVLSVDSLHPEDTTRPFVRWAVRHKKSIRRLPIVGGWAVAAYHRSADAMPVMPDGPTRGERVARRIPIVGPALVWFVRLVLLPQRFAKLSAAFVQLEQRTRSEHALLISRMEQLDAARPGARRGQKCFSVAGRARELDETASGLVGEIMTMLSDLVTPGAGRGDEPRFALVGYEGQGPEWLEQLLRRFDVECVDLSVSSETGVRQGRCLSESDVTGTIEGCPAGSLVGVSLDATQEIGGPSGLASVLSQAFAATRTSGILMVEGVDALSGPQASGGDAFRGETVRAVTPDEMSGLLRSAGYADVRVAGAREEGADPSHSDDETHTRYTLTGRRP